MNDSDILVLQALDFYGPLTVAAIFEKVDLRGKGITRTAVSRSVLELRRAALVRYADGFTGPSVFVITGLGRARLNE